MKALVRAAIAAASMLGIGGAMREESLKGSAEDEKTSQNPYNSQKQRIIDRSQADQNAKKARRQARFDAGRKK